MKKVLFILLLCCGFRSMNAQFITAGKIEFEKRTNQHSLLEDESMWDDMMRKVVIEIGVGAHTEFLILIISHPDI